MPDSTTNDLPKRIQRKRTKGWKMPENTVIVDRTSRWGNPYVIGEPVSRSQVKKWGWNFYDLSYIAVDAADAVRRFTGCIAMDDCMIAEVRKRLRGKNLACFCDPSQPCHADVLLEIANS